ncbi:DNA replication and repair protein RecR [Arcticibacter tournemirensis]|nr:DNA replication and repair protein RecR [Arcticibacter tournemirensis]
MYLCRMNFSSRLLENAVNEFSKLPGVGQKTALRLVLHLLNQSSQEVENLSDALTRLKREIRYCKVCGNISDSEVCGVCSANKRDKSLVCIVEDTRDIMAIENTNQYNGVYHVLGGLISPMDGIGPSDLNIERLVERVKTGEIEEVILALSATMEGDTTIFYIFKKLKDLPVKISTIARGIAFGGEIEYADEITLARSIATRVPYGVES